MRLTRLFSIIATLLVFVSLARAQDRSLARTFDESGRATGFVALPPGSPKESITSLTINGQTLKGDVKIEAQGATLDPATNTILLRSDVANITNGAGQQGNTTISGTLTVTGNTFFNSNSSTYGATFVSYGAPAASTAITITADVTTVQDAGANVTITLPAGPASGLSRRLTIKNASNTYTVSDGGSISISPNSRVELVWINSAWE